MTTFESQLISIADSTQSLCAQAEVAGFSGTGWTPAIILGHIVDVNEEVWMARFAMMRDALHSGQEPPQLTWWEPDGEKTAEKYAKYSVADSVALLRKSRNEMSIFLKSLSVADRGASARHKTFGTITIESMLQIILNHDEEHRASIN